MTFKLDKRETNSLFQLIALGWHILEQTCDEQERKPYSQLVNELVTNYVCYTGKQPLTKNQINILLKNFFYKMREYLDRYIENTMPSELAKRVAEYHYSLKDNKDLETCIRKGLAEEIYENEIKEKGMAAIYIDVADLDEQMEELMKEYKVSENI